MSKPKSRPHTHYAAEAAELLGVLIRCERTAKKMTVLELATRAGISRGLVQRIEKGELSCSIGAVFELAAIVGLPLFDADRVKLGDELHTRKHILCLLPQKVKLRKLVVKDDF